MGKDDLNLTQDIGLRPAVEVSETQRQRGNEIFEKEQELLIQAAQREQSEAKDILYVNDFGYVHLVFYPTRIV